MRVQLQLHIVRELRCSSCEYVKRVGKEEADRFSAGENFYGPTACPACSMSGKTAYSLKGK